MRRGEAGGDISKDFAQGGVKPNVDEEEQSSPAIRRTDHCYELRSTNSSIYPTQTLLLLSQLAGSSSSATVTEPVVLTCCCRTSICNNGQMMLDTHGARWMMEVCYGGTAPIGACSVISSRRIRFCCLLKQEVFNPRGQLWKIIPSSP